MRLHLILIISGSRSISLAYVVTKPWNIGMFFKCTVLRHTKNLNWTWFVVYSALHHAPITNTSNSYLYMPSYHITFNAPAMRHGGPCLKTFPGSKVHGAHLGPVGPRWAPCWPHEPCYLVCCHIMITNGLIKEISLITGDTFSLACENSGNQMRITFLITNSFYSSCSILLFIKARSPHQQSH